MSSTNYLTCCIDSPVQVCSLASGSAVRKYGSAGGSSAAALSGPSGNLFCVSPTRPLLTMLQLHANGNARPLKSSIPCMGSCVAIVGNFLFLGSSTGSITCWCATTGSLLNEFDAHFRAVVCVASSHDEALLTTGGDDGVMHVWLVASLVDQGLSDAASSSPLVTCRHALRVTGIAHTAQQRIYSCSMDSTLCCWTHKGSRLSCSVFPSALTCVAVDQRDTCAFVGSQLGNIYHVADAWAQDVVVGPDDVCMRGHQGEVTALAVAQRAGRMVVVSGGADSTSRVFDALSCQELFCVRHTSTITHVSIVGDPAAAPVAPMALTTLQKYVVDDPLVWRTSVSASSLRKRPSVLMLDVKSNDSMMDSQLIQENERLKEQVSELYERSVNAYLTRATADVPEGWSISNNVRSKKKKIK